MAFGARPNQVVRMIVRDSAVPIGAGTVLGVGGALLATRVIESFLFETAPTDPATLAAVAVILATAAGAASPSPRANSSSVLDITALPVSM